MLKLMGLTVQLNLMFWNKIIISVCLSLDLIRRISILKCQRNKRNGNLIASKMSLLIKSGPFAGAWHRIMGPAVGWNSAKKILLKGPSSPHPSYLESLMLMLMLLLILKTEMRSRVVADGVEAVAAVVDVADVVVVAK